MFRFQYHYKALAWGTSVAIFIFVFTLVSAICFGTHHRDRWKVKNDKNWHIFVNIFIEKMKKEKKSYQCRNFERFVFIKEACGNTYLSLIFSLFILASTHFLKFYLGIITYKVFIQIKIYFIPILLVYMILIISLYFMHFIHVQRQVDYIESC